MQSRIVILIYNILYIYINYYYLLFVISSSFLIFLPVTKSKVTKYNLCNLSLIRLIVFQTVRTVRSFVRSKTLALQTMAVCAINYGSFL